MGSPRRRMAINSPHRVYKVEDAAGTARSAHPYLRGVPLLDVSLHSLPPHRRGVLQLVEFIEEDVRAAAAADDDTSVSAAAHPPAAHRQPAQLAAAAQLLQPGAYTRPLLSST